jgi:hypothetical protein
MKKSEKDWICIYCPDIRLRARRVNECSIVQEVKERAEKMGKFAWCVTHGGSVPNSYNYPAETEGLVVGALPGRKPVGWIIRMSANKVTTGGIVSQIREGLRPLCDERYKKVNKQAAEKMLQQIVDEQSNPLRHLVLTGEVS